jgi:PIN domain nuclease of toxin-antitoxin system
MRRILLDTHAFLWALSDDESLGDVAASIIINPDNQVFVSAVSIWEAGIKVKLNKLVAPDNLDEAIQLLGCKELPISAFHGKQAAKLPMHHADPFDRLLIAQAQAEGLELMTCDSVFPLYGIQLIDAKR